LGENNWVLKRFYVYFTPIQNELPDYDLFYMLSSIKNAEFIGLGLSNFPEIPANAFRPINGFQNKLTGLDISGKIKKLGDFAFYNLNSLEYLNLIDILVDHISSNTFNFEKESKKTLDLYLDHNLLNGSNTEINSFINLKRPTIIHSTCRKLPCNLTYLDEKVFPHFFDLNQSNIITSYGEVNKIDCSDCRSFWINDKNYDKRIVNITCSNGKSLTDSSIFLDCKK